MKVFVTGVCGQLGHDVVNELISRGHEAIGSDITEKYAGVDDCTAVLSAPYKRLDITDSDAVKAVFSEVNPDAVVHCAAWTAVDAAEDEENREKVYAINAGGTRNIAAVCKELGCKMLYISTDYVFDGEGTQPWKPDCKAYAPLCIYGDSKLQGELAVSGLLEKYFIILQISEKVKFYFRTNDVRKGKIGKIIIFPYLRHNFRRSYHMPEFLVHGNKNNKSFHPLL